MSGWAVAGCFVAAWILLSPLVGLALGRLVRHGEEQASEEHAARQHRRHARPGPPRTSPPTPHPHPYTAPTEETPPMTSPIDWGDDQPEQPAPARHIADTITDDDLDQLYAELAMQTQWTATYKAAWHSAQARALGRHDAIARAEQAETAASMQLDRADHLSGALCEAVDHIRNSGQASSTVDRLITRATRAQRWSEPNWRCPNCDGSVPYHQRHDHLVAEAERRAEQAAAAIARVRAFCDELDASIVRLTKELAAVHPVAAKVRYLLDEPKEPRT